jgi:hypothetical protein
MPESVWQVAVFPLDVQIGDRPHARPTLTVVTSAGRMLNSRVAPDPLGELYAIAEHIEDVVAEAARAHGRWPAIVVVADEAIAIALVERYAPRDVAVGLGPVPECHLAGLAVREQLTGNSRWPVTSVPASWFAWGLPEDWIACFFDAAAKLYHARVRELLTGGSPVTITLTGTTGIGWWTMKPSVREDGSLELGFFTNSADIEVPATGDGVPAWSGRVLLLTFQKRERLPEPMHREIVSSGWPVAGRGAWPLLLTVNTPAGGLSRRLGDELVSMLEALARFIDAKRDDLEPRSGRRPVHWADGQAVVWYKLPGPFKWPVPARLEPSLPAGPGADPLAEQAPQAEAGTLPPEAEPLIDAFRSTLEATGIRPLTVQRHVDNASAFVEFLSLGEVPLAAATERDLRRLLYDWYPRRVRTEVRREAVRTSLRKFFRWLEDAHAIACPWAWSILDDGMSFLMRSGDAPRVHAPADEVAEWENDMRIDLERRAMMPGARIDDHNEWDPQPGTIEFSLFRRLERLWMIWRDERIRAGVTDPAALQAELLARQAEWTGSPPDAEFADRSVRQIVLDERAARRSRARPDRRRPAAERAPDAQANDRELEPFGPSPFEHIAAAHNLRAVLLTLDKVAASRPFPPAIVEAARRLIAAYAAARPADIARLRNPGVWAGGAVHAACLLAGDVDGPTCAILARFFRGSASAVGGCSSRLRHVAPSAHSSEDPAAVPRPASRLRLVRGDADRPPSGGEGPRDPADGDDDSSGTRRGEIRLL